MEDTQQVDVYAEVLLGFWGQDIGVAADIQLTRLVNTGAAVVGVFSFARRQRAFRLRDALVVFEPSHALAGIERLQTRRGPRFDHDEMWLMRERRYRSVSSIQFRASAVSFHANASEYSKKSSSLHSTRNSRSIT